MRNPRGDAGQSAGGKARRVLLGPGPAAVLALLCFANSIGNGFVYDDRALVLDNPRIHTLTDFRALWLSDWWYPRDGSTEADPQRDRLYRPLTLFSLALNYGLHGLHPVGYHLTNVLLHAATCLLVWSFARRLTDDSAIASLSAVLFAVHPVHAEAVANVVGRAEVLATLLLLLGLLALQPRRAPPGPGRAGLAMLAFLAALLAKETAICYPAVALLLLWARYRRTGLTRRWWLMHALCLLPPLLVYLPLRYLALEHRLFRVEPADVLMNPLVVASLGERLIGVLTILGHYTRLLIVPARLSSDYGIGIVDPRQGFTLMTALGLVAVMAAGLALLGFLRRGLLWRRLATLTAMLLASYALISNTVLLIGVTLAERLLYWPSVLALTLAATGIVELWRRRCAPGMPLASSAGLLRGLGGLLVLALMLRTAVRNIDWSNNWQLFATDVATYPQGAHLNKCYAVELLGLWDQTQDPTERIDLLNQALRHIQTAIRILPGYAAALALRGRVRAQLGEIDGALLDVEAALQLDPSLCDARQTRAQLLYGVAADDRLTTMRNNADAHPDDPAARRELGAALLQYGRYAEARQQLERALELSPGNLDTLRELGKVLALTQQEQRATKVFAQVLSVDPNDWQAHANLAALLAHRDPTAALDHARRAYDLAPAEPRNGINLAEAYELNGQRGRAVELYRRVARELDKDDPLRAVVTQRLETLEKTGKF